MQFSLSGIKKALLKILGVPDEDTASVAKNRLKLVLVHDRVKISPQEMEQLKHDLIAAISKYVAIDQEQVEVSLTKKDKTTSLIVNIPVKIRKGEKEGANRNLARRKKKK